MKSKEQYFIELLNSLIVKPYDKYPFWVSYVGKHNDMIYISYDKKNNIAYLNYNKIWKVFESLNDYNKIREITGVLLERHLKLKGVTTEISYRE